MLKPLAIREREVGHDPRREAMRFRTRAVRANELLSEQGCDRSAVDGSVAILIVAIVLIPFGAQAAQTVAAIITDAGGTNQAHVDSGGNLFVSDSGGRRVLVGRTCPSVQAAGIPISSTPTTAAASSCSAGG
jgi:hypothetical protein